MAVQTQYIAHAFPHDPRAIRPTMDDIATSGSVFLGEPGGGRLLAPTVRRPVAVRGNTDFSDPRSDLTACNNGGGGIGCFAPRKRPRVSDVAGAGLIMDLELEGQRALLPPSVPMPLPPAFAAAGDVQGRPLCSGTASTSGRPTTAEPASHGLLSHLYRHSVEIDTLVRVESERLRAGLEEARRRHVRAVVSAVERAAARRLRAAEADLERALARNGELDERLRQMGAEGQAWQGIASSHEAAAAGLRATLSQLLQSPCAEGEGNGEAEDARSCCFGQGPEEPERAAGGGGSSRAACRACGEAGACVLLLPCRHLCLCAGCEAAAEACPVCAATKNASLHVLLS